MMGKDKKKSAKAIEPDVEQFTSNNNRWNDMVTSFQSILLYGNASASSLPKRRFGRLTVDSIVFSHRGEDGRR